MDEFDSRPESDIGIYDLDPLRAGGPAVQQQRQLSGAYDVVLDLPALIDHEAEPADPTVNPSIEQP